MSTESTVDFEFRLPDTGEGLTEATIEDWLVEEGETVEEAQPLLEVETDKAIVEIPAPCEGTLLERRGKVGEVRNVGEVIAVIETDDPPRQIVEEGNPATAEQGKRVEAERDRAESKATRTTDSAAESDMDGEREIGVDADSGPQVDRSAGDTDPAVEPAETSTRESSNGDERIFAAPSTRRRANELGVDLTAVEGSGPSGRITERDVEEYHEAQQAEPTTTEATSPAPAASRVQVPAEGTLEQTADGPVEREPFTGLRRTIADNMSRSWDKVPHVTSGASVPAKKFIELKESLDEKHDTRITYTPLMVKAVVPALEEFPMVNAEIDEENDEIVHKKYYNVGVATNTEAGLIVPVIKDVDQKSILEIAEELNEIVEQTHERSISADKLQGSTFTLTNTGSHGSGDSGTRGRFGTPIINHPEVAILGMGRIRNEVVPVSDDEMEVQKRLPLTFSYDHRVIDGITAGQFMGRVTSMIEDPDLLLSRI